MEGTPGVDLVGLLKRGTSQSLAQVVQSLLVGLDLVEQVASDGCQFVEHVEVASGRTLFEVLGKPVPRFLQVHILDVPTKALQVRPGLMAKDHHVEVFFNVSTVETPLFSLGKIDRLRDIGKDVLGQVEAIQGPDDHLSPRQEVLLFDELVDEENSPRLGRGRA